MSNLPLLYDNFDNENINSKVTVNNARYAALDNNMNDYFNSFYVESDYNIDNFYELLNESKNDFIDNDFIDNDFISDEKVLLNNYYDNRLDNNVQKDQRKKYKPKMDMITHFYTASLSIIALFIVFRMIEKTK
jgi:hypothetical protein